MMVDTTEQGGNVTYAMPNFGELPGFAEAARAFKHAGAQTEIPEPVLQLIAAHEPKISEKDVESLINEVVSKSGLSRSAPQIAEFIAEALSNVGAARAALSSLREVGLRAADAAKAEAGSDETPQQKMTRLSQEIAQLTNEIKKDADRLHERGLITDREHAELAALDVQIESLPVGDPRRRQLEEQRTERQREIFGNAGERAHERGDREGEEIVYGKPANGNEPAQPGTLTKVEKRDDSERQLAELAVLNSQIRNEHAEPQINSQEVDRSVVRIASEKQEQQQSVLSNNRQTSEQAAPRSLFDAIPVNQEAEPVRLAVATVAEAPTASPTTPVTEAQRNAGASVTL